MAGAQRNPPWDKAEIILALNLYLNHESDTKHYSLEEAKSLSSILRSLRRHDDIADPEAFRNLNGVKTKLANLQHLDPNDPSVGLSGASRLDREIWDQYHDKPELVRQLAESIVAELGDAATPMSDYLISSDEELEYPEGALFYRMHVSRERNSEVVRKAKERAAIRGELHCSVCGFDFEKAYGGVGKGFIECHHKKPISEYKGGEKTRVEDLAIVCSNCHRMLHRGGSVLTPEKLREVVLGFSVAG